MIIKETRPIHPFNAFAAIRRLDMPFIFAGGVFKRRYSFVGASPFAIVRTTAQGTEVNDLNGRIDSSKTYKDPFEAIKVLISAYAPKEPGPLPFNSGAVGYFAYDLKDVLAAKPSHAKKAGKHGLGLCLSVIGFYSSLYVYDHEENKGYITYMETEKGNSRHSIKEALENLDGADFFPLQCQPSAGATGAQPFAKMDVRPAKAGFSSDTSKEEYLSSIKKAHEYISNGDIYQINLSHRLELPWDGDGFSLFASLLEKRPSPMNSYIDFKDFELISNSPERFLRADRGSAETSPIKGTRPRGNTPDEDAALVKELLSSEKERAEHVMIVDLERSDLGMAAEKGTVEVEDFGKIETFAKLHHMVSTVRARLRADVGPIGCLKAMFPGGSVTGAPKIRAMEIIAELEKTPRGIYTGCIGWIDFSTRLDMAIAIRTAVYKDKTLYLNVGGGIVADSDPEAEYEETLLKAKDFLDILGLKKDGSNPPAPTALNMRGQA
ncbi:MAG: aminodeoxychorismate synthase component I [Deltaproteobacteria bacterium]|nr:aminodeoxychorismate synthase component I [Deltaproteobacteria bacterium]